MAAPTLSGPVTPPGVGLVGASPRACPGSVGGRHKMASLHPSAATVSRAQTFPRPLDTSHRLGQAALSLLHKIRRTADAGAEVVSLALRVSDLTKAPSRQLTLWTANVNCRGAIHRAHDLCPACSVGVHPRRYGENEMRLDQAIEAIRRRYGARSLARGAEADLPRPRMAELILQEQAAPQVK